MKTIFLNTILVLLAFMLVQPCFADGHGFAFKVGNIKVSNYIYERELNKLVTRSKRELKQADKQAWLDAWVDRLIIVNKAREQRIEDEPQIRESVLAMSQYMLIYGPGSPFARRFLDPRLGAEEQLPENLQKSRRAKLSEIQKEVAKQISFELNSDLLPWVIRNIDALQDRSVVLSEFASNTDWFVQYSLDASKSNQELGLEGFFEKYRRKVIRRLIRDEPGLRREVRELLIDEALSIMAIENGLHNDAHFLLEKENYKQGEEYHRYVKQRVQMPSDVELSAWYDAHKQQYIQVTRAQFWRAEASNGNLLGSIKQKVAAIRSKYTNQAEFLSKLEELADDLGLTKTTLSLETSMEINPIAFNSQPGSIFPILNFGEEYRLLLKIRDLEQGVPSLGRIRERVFNDCKKEQFSEQEREILNNLKATYQIEWSDVLSGQFARFSSVEL